MPRELRLICHPFHNGLEGIDMGAGPLRLVGDPSISDELRAQGWDLQLETIETPDPNDPEIVRIAEGDRRLARRVRAAHEGGAFPLVLAGNCNSCLGTVAGLGPVGVVWFDAHADFDTPDRSLGFFDGMGLAILTGNGWELLRQTIPGFMPVDERDVVLVGVRDLEEHQRAPLDASAMRILPGPSFDSTGFLHALDELRQRASRTYLHIDLDVLDTSEGRANRFAAAGGLSAQQLEWAVEMVFRRSAVAAAALTAYDPGLDEDGRMARAASRVIATVARSALESGPPPPGGPDAPSFRLRR
ncbi:MAG TPA: arginase family protein [Thermoleophilaceae bacterium]